MELALSPVIGSTKDARNMTELNAIQAANEAFAAQFTQGDLPMPPARHLAILTCMDARLHPDRFFGLALGDAHVIRNAGGRASDDAIRSLIISSTLLGTREFLVIHHTDCGMLTFTNEALRERLRADLQTDASDIDFLPFTDLKTSVQDDVDRILGSPFLASGITVSGHIYDVTSGRLEQVVPPAST